MIRWPEHCKLAISFRHCNLIPSNNLRLQQESSLEDYVQLSNTTAKKGENPNCKHFQIIVILYNYAYWCTGKNSR